MVLFRHQTRQVEPLKARRSLCKGHTSKRVLECAHRSPSAPCELHCLFKPKGISLIVVGVACRVVGIKVRKVDPVAYGFRRRLLWKISVSFGRPNRDTVLSSCCITALASVSLAKKIKACAPPLLLLNTVKGKLYLAKKKQNRRGSKGYTSMSIAANHTLLSPRQRNYPNGLCSFDMLLVNLVRDCRLFSV